MAADFTSLFGLYVLSLLLVAIEARSGEYCYTYPYSTSYCRYGCCGTGLDQYCCSISVGVIIGGVIGGIACICIVIAVICCCVKHTTYKGRVIGTQGVPVRAAPSNVTVVTSAMGYQQPMAGYPPNPQAFPPHYYHQGPPMNRQPPPPYAYANAAYPPPPPIATPGGFAAPAAPAYTSPAAPAYPPANASDI